MKKVKNENIVTFHNAYQVNNGIYIITEFCEGGDLKQQMATHFYNEE